MLKIRLVYHTRGLTYVRIQAVGVTSCRIKKMVEHTDNQKKRGNAENKFKQLSTISGTDKVMYHGYQR